MTAKRLSEAVDHGRKIDFELGTQLKVDLQGALKPVKGTFVGMHTGHYVVIEIPKLFPAKNIKGQNVTVRYLQSGAVFGFTSFVIWHIVGKTFDILFLVYPLDIEIYELRKHPRVECYLPASISIGNLNTKAIISDIGMGGCRLTIISKEHWNLEVDQQVKIKCQTFAVFDEHHIICKIRSVSDDTSNLQVGVQFISLEPEIKKEIEEYVERVSEIVLGVPTRT